MESLNHRYRHIPKPGGVIKPPLSVYPKPGGIVNPPLSTYPKPGGILKPSLSAYPKPGGIVKPLLPVYPNPGGAIKPPLSAYPKPGGIARPPLSVYPKPGGIIKPPLPAYPKSVVSRPLTFNKGGVSGAYPGGKSHGVGYFPGSSFKSGYFPKYKHFGKSYKVAYKPFPAVPPLPSVCPYGWLPYAGSCYLFSRDRLDWFSAQVNDI